MEVGIQEQAASQEPFVNVDTLGLRRSDRLARNPFKGTYAISMIAFTALATHLPQTATLSFAALAQCYQAEYQDFLEMNFDGTPNDMSPLAQIYTTSKSNNEVCNIIEVLQ